MSDSSYPGAPGIRRVLTAVVGAQVAIAAALLLIDLTTARPRVDPLTAPLPAGPATRPYSPDRAPAGVPGLAPMPERLEIIGEGGTVTLTGQIAPGDGARIAQDLATRRAAGQAVVQVNLDSTGGSVFDALEIGEAIRATSLATHVGDEAVCLSACPYILAGGTDRSVAATGQVGVHQHYFGERTYLPAFMAVKDIQRGQAAVMSYLDRMGIGLGVMEHAMRTPPEQIYLLSPEELAEYGLITG